MGTEPPTYHGGATVVGQALVAITRTRTIAFLLIALLPSLAACSGGEGRGPTQLTPEQRDASTAVEDPTLILAGRSLGASDMPPGFSLVTSSLFRTEELLREADDDPMLDRELASRRLRSWRFIAGEYREYANPDRAGLLGVIVRVWATENPTGAENAFIDGAFLADFEGELGQSEPALQTFGDESEALRFSSNVPDYPLRGMNSDVEGFVFVIRVGRYLGSIWTLASPGHDHLVVLEGLALVLEERLSN